MDEAKMNQLIRFGVVLATICLIATLVLAVTHEITKPLIEDKLRIEEETALKAIIPDADSFNEKEADEISYFEAMRDNRLVGYCVRVTGNGYNGFIRMIVGIDLNGEIQGVKILEHQETPGLGSKINEVLLGEKEPYFLRQFKGKQARSVAVKKDIDAITGATISSRAVTVAISLTVSEFLAKVKR